MKPIDQCKCLYLGFKKNDHSEDGVGAVYDGNIPAVGSPDALAKPPPLLPTPGRTPLMAIGKPSLLRDRPSAGLLPTPGWLLFYL